MCRVIEWWAEINESTSSWPQSRPNIAHTSVYVHIKQSCVIWINFSTVITLIRLIWDNFTGTWFIHAQFFAVFTYIQYIGQVVVKRTHAPIRFMFIQFLNDRFEGGQFDNRGLFWFEKRNEISSLNCFLFGRAQKVQLKTMWIKRLTVMPAK